MPFPILDRSTIKPFRCNKCTNMEKCEHGFRTYRIPNLSEYGIDRNINPMMMTSNFEYGKYPPNKYTITRSYYPYNYHLSRDSILRRLRNGRMNQ